VQAFDTPEKVDAEAPIKPFGRNAAGLLPLGSQVVHIIENSCPAVLSPAMVDLEQLNSERSS
jgi:hypothetical protein